MQKMNKKELLYPIIFFILSILFFYSNLTFSYLQMGDVLFWDFNNIKNALLNGMPYFWDDAYFTIQTTNTVIMHPRTLILLFFPIEMLPQMSIIFHIFIAGYSTFLLLRYKKLSLEAAFFGAIALMFSNAMTTLILPGHLEKFETYSYFPLVLFFLSVAMDRENILYFIFTAAALGTAFLGGNIDVAMYFAIFLSFYFLFLLYQKKGELKLNEYLKLKYKKIIMLCLKFTFVAVFSFLMSIQVIMITINTQEQGAAGVETKSELWDWATRWSFPPEEVLSFFMPGFFGNYSGSVDAPYWGRIANMEGDLATSNYSLTSANIGVITFLMIILALLLKYKNYKEKYFWIITALFFLIASFGRYFPLVYGALFNLPFFSDARNPNKFIEIIPIPFSILAAFGFDYVSKVIKAREKDNLLGFLSDENNNYKYVSIFIKYIYIFTLSVLVFSIISFLAKDFIYSIFLADWESERAGKISSNIVMSFMRLFLLLSSASILIKNVFSLKENTPYAKYLIVIPITLFAMLNLFLRSDIIFFIIVGVLVLAYLILVSNNKRVCQVLPYAFMAILMLDLFQSGNSFIVKSDTDKMYEGTPITEHILKEGGNTTTIPVLIPYLYRYTTHTMPYFNIDLTEPPAVSRLSKDITQTFTAFRINDYATYQPRFMDLLGARYILSPTYLDNSIIKDSLTHITEYQDEYSSAVLYEIKDYRSEFEYAHNIYKASDYDEALAIMTSQNFNLINDVILYSDIIITDSDSDKNYIIDIISKNENEVVVNIDASNSGVLLYKELYNDEWSVFVDGEKKEMLKANILFRGVYLEAGNHEVIFKFTPKMIYFYSTAICWIITILSGILFLAIYKKRLKDYNIG